MKSMMIATALCLGLVAAASGGLAEPAPAPSSANLVMSQQIDFVSKVNGHAYRIQIATPFGPAPKGGYPVLYVLDGDAYFPLFASGARLRALTNEIEQTVIVGIGYPDSQNNFAKALARRTYDLTQAEDLNSASRKVNEALTPGERLEFGHADDFIKVIDTEIKPRVAAALPVNPERTAIFGHSLGGLFVLHTLFTHPKAFQTYLALSPSIWTVDKLVLKDEPAFSRLVAEGQATPRIYIGVGGEEQSISKYAPQPGITVAESDRGVQKDAMVDNARDLASRLAALKGAPGYVVNSRIFEGETHIRVPYASMNTVLSFAFPRETP